MRELPLRLLTISYVVALGIIAVMSLGSHFTLHQIISDNQGSATVVNISGRQRMLSQRIASLAAQSALGDPTVRDDLAKAIDVFAAAHEDLTRGNPLTGLPAATSDELRALYFGGDHPLDEQVGAFLTCAHLLRDLPAADPRRPALLHSLFAMTRQPLLSGLDAVVTTHQRSSEAKLARLTWLQNVSLGVVLLTLVAEALGIFRPMAGRIGRLVGNLQVLATVDPLTGALNRRSFTERARAELSRANRTGRPVCLLTIDADRFKAVNDTYGHPAGDAVLQALTACLSRTLRPSDICSRIGGEEFAVLLPETGLSDATLAAERVRKAVADLTVPIEGGAEIRFTISIGLADVRPGDTGLDDTLRRADLALYEAKSGGRNRVAVMGRGRSATALGSAELSLA